MKHVDVASWLVNILLGVSVLMFALIVIPAALGYHRYVIDGQSMEPTIPYGSVVYNQTVPVDDLAVGDVITFTPPPEYNVSQPVTHRIISIEKNDAGQRVYHTQGDNNSSPDPWAFTLDQSTQSRVSFHIPYIGYVYIALSVWWVRFLAIVLPAIAAAVWLAIALWREAGREVDEEKRRRGLAEPGGAS